MEILDFVAVMFGLFLVLLGAALAAYYKKEKARQRLIDPRHDHLYHYTKPHIWSHSADCDEHHHHTHHHHHHHAEE